MALFLRPESSCYLVDPYAVSQIRYLLIFFGVSQRRSSKMLACNEVIIIVTTSRFISEKAHFVYNYGRCDALNTSF